MSSFAPARKTQVPVKIGIVGPSGSGKTYTALRMATGIAGENGRIAVIDTEHGSALEYADVFNFAHAALDGDYGPSQYVAKMKEAEQEGFDVLVIDGISPAWNGPGGVQEIVDKNTKGGNNWSGWAVGTPEHQKLLEAILASRIHLICTMRAKTAWAMEVRNGKQVPVKVGLEPVQRDSIEYEFTVVGHLDLEHNMTITKSRRQAVPVGVVINQPGEGVGARLLAMSLEGEPVPDVPKPDPTPNPPTPAEPNPPAATNGKITADQILRLDQLATQLDEAKPDTNWHEKIKSAVLKDYGLSLVHEMSSEQADAILERLGTTLAGFKAEAI